MQIYLINFGGDLWQISRFNLSLGFPHPIKTDLHDIT